MFFDTHNHSQFSFDGSGTTVGKSAVAAAEKGLGGICFTDHCDFYVPQMKERFEPIVSEVFDIDAQQAEIDRVNGLIAEGGLGKSVPRKFRIFKGMELGLGERTTNRQGNASQATSSTRSSRRSTTLRTPTLISGRTTRERTGRKPTAATLRSCSGR